METTRLENFEELLDKFKKLPDRVERPPTFMEIAGYPHYENVCSNILAFFMDPEEPHGLGTLVLDALMSVGNSAEADKVIGGNVSVEREVNTDKGRIDVLITSDDHAIVIENKIHAGVSNPFDDYSAYLDRIADGREKHKFILTLDPTNEGKDWDFENLTHKEFVERIRLLLGRYISSTDTRCLTMFLDFLNMLENLQKESRMDQKFVRLIAERTEDVENLLTGVKEFKKELQRKVRGLDTLINVGEYQNVEQWFYREEPHLYDCLVHDIRVSEDLPANIDTTIYPTGWEISIGLREGNLSNLGELLQNLGIPAKEDGDCFVHLSHFAYDENVERISPILQGIIDKLATYREA